MKLLIHLSLVLLASAAFAQPAIKKARAEYGSRVRYVDGAHDYPDFAVRFLKREEYRPPGTNLLGITYTFDVLSKKEEKIAAFVFSFSGLAVTTCDFEVGGKTFVAELSYSTAGQPVPREVPPKQNGMLPEGVIVIWDEASARTGNLQLLEFWKKKEANQPPEPTPLTRRGSS